MKRQLSSRFPVKVDIRFGESIRPTLQLLGKSVSNGARGVQTDELLFEANDNIKLYRGLYFVTDVRYNIRPSGAPTYHNAWVVGLQIHAKF